MPDTRIDAAITSAMNEKDQTDETATDFRRGVSEKQQDSPGTKYRPDWNKWYGYYKQIPELQATIDTFSKWTIGKGVKADAKTLEKLLRIRGFGKDTYNSIMHNMVRQYKIGGDAFAEIIKNKRGELINLKPMNPGSMTILSNKKGILTGYEKTVIPEPSQNNNPQTFSLDEVFHLPWNRLGDEVHGISTIQKLVDVIDARNEAMKDLRIVFHRYVKPLMISEVDTDDETEIAAFKTKMDSAVEKMENIVIPKDTAQVTRISIPQFSTLDPLPWIRTLQQFFILSEGVPEVILGWGKDTTEASSKILYLAFQQNIEDNQLFLEQQTLAQLKLKVEFNFPADLAAHLQGDMQKEGNVGLQGGKKNDGTKTGTPKATDSTPN